jgi:hypothetical protein
VADHDDRGELDRVIATARPKVRRWDSLKPLEKRAHVVETWEAIAGALNEAYLEQRTGRVNYRLTQQDVFYARRVAVWMRFELELQTWRDDEANAASETIAKRAKGQTGPAAVVTDDVKTRLASKPKPPDSREPPVLPPRPEDKPHDWPPMTGMWSVWIEEFVRVRRAVASPRSREPGDDDDEGGEHAGDKPVGHTMTAGKGPDARESEDAGGEEQQQGPGDAARDAREMSRNPALAVDGEAAPAPASEEAAE